MSSDTIMLPPSEGWEEVNERASEPKAEMTMEKKLEPTPVSVISIEPIVQPVPTKPAFREIELTPSEGDDHTPVYFSRDVLLTHCPEEWKDSFECMCTEFDAPSTHRALVRLSQYWYREKVSLIFPVEVDFINEMYQLCIKWKYQLGIKKCKTAYKKLVPSVDILNTLPNEILMEYQKQFMTEHLRLIKSGDLPMLYPAYLSVELSRLLLHTYAMQVAPEQKKVKKVKKVAEKVTGSMKHLKVGDIRMVKDRNGKWYIACIREAIENPVKPGRVKVAFINWAEKNDEWIGHSNKIHDLPKGSSVESVIAEEMYGRRSGAGARSVHRPNSSPRRDYDSDGGCCESSDEDC